MTYIFEEFRPLGWAFAESLSNNSKKKHSSENEAKNKENQDPKKNELGLRIRIPNVNEPKGIEPIDVEKFRQKVGSSMFYFKGEFRCSKIRISLELSIRLSP